MASELKVDKFTGVTTAGAITITLENSESQILQKGIAKLTGNVTQAASLNANSSLNISSVADGSAGVNTITATNPFSAELAAVGLATIHDSSYNRGINIGNTSTTDFITRAFTSNTGGVQDTDADTAVAILGDLA